MPGREKQLQWHRPRLPCQPTRVHHRHHAQRQHRHRPSHLWQVVGEGRRRPCRPCNLSVCQAPAVPVPLPVEVCPSMRAASHRHYPRLAPFPSPPPYPPSSSLQAAHCPHPHPCQPQPLLMPMPAAGAHNTVAPPLSRQCQCQWSWQWLASTAGAVPVLGAQAATPGARVAAVAAAGACICPASFLRLVLLVRDAHVFTIPLSARLLTPPPPLFLCAAATILVLPVVSTGQRCPIPSSAILCCTQPIRLAPLAPLAVLPISSIQILPSFLCRRVLPCPLPCPIQSHLIPASQSVTWPTSHRRRQFALPLPLPLPLHPPIQDR